MNRTSRKQFISHIELFGARLTSSNSRLVSIIIEERDQVPNASLLLAQFSVLSTGPWWPVFFGWIFCIQPRLKSRGSQSIFEPPAGIPLSRLILAPML
jgi:hypothetical protein